MPSHTTADQDRAFDKAASHANELLEYIETLTGAIERLDATVDEKIDEVANLRAELEEARSEISDLARQLREAQ